MDEQIEVALYEQWPRPNSGGRLVEVFSAGFQTMESRAGVQGSRPVERTDLARGVNLNNPADDAMVKTAVNHILPRMNRDVATPTQLVDARQLQDGGRIRELKKHSGVHPENLQTSVWDQAFEGIAEAAFLAFIILLQEACTAAPGVAAWSYITVRLVFFCRAGRHRSVLMAWLFSHWLASLGVPTRLSHMSGPMYDIGCGCSGCMANEHDQRKRRWAMGKAFDFWNGLLTRELGSRLPADVWEAVLNPPNREPAPHQGETVDEAFERMRAENMRPTSVQLTSAAARRTRVASRTHRRARLQDDVDQMSEEQLAALEERLAARRQRLQEEAEATQAEPEQEDEDLVPGETRHTGGARGSGGGGGSPASPRSERTPATEADADEEEESASASTARRGRGRSPHPKRGSRPGTPHRRRSKSAGARSRSASRMARQEGSGMVPAPGVGPPGDRLMGLTELPPSPCIVEWPQRTHGVPEAAVRQPRDILTPEDLLTATNNRDRNFSLLPESWTRIDVKIRSGDSRPLRHPQWFIGRMVKTTFALERGRGPPPSYDWVLLEKRAPITDVNTFEVEARPPLTVIFLQQAYDMIFYEPEPEPKRTWEEQLNPPLPAVLGTGEGKGKGKDKGKVKGPLFRGGPAPGRDAQQGYTDRWGRARQYRYYKGGSKHCREIVQSPLPPQDLARPAGRSIVSMSLLLGLCPLMSVGSGEQVGSPDPTPKSMQPSHVREGLIMRGGCPATPPQDRSDRSSREARPPMTHLMMRLVLAGTTDAVKPSSAQAKPMKHHGGRQWWKGMRIGEASHPGPPKASAPHTPMIPLGAVRATGAPTRISLTQVGGGGAMEVAARLPTPPQLLRSTHARKCPSKLDRQTPTDSSC